MSVLGIDPGKSGGIVFIGTWESHALPALGAWKMPATERDVFDILRDVRDVNPDVQAVIEKVGAMPGQGVTSMFNFGMNYGGLRMALIAAGIPFRTVAPGVWQRLYGLPTLKACGGSGTVKKNAHKARAQELFPAIKVTHALADALLIAEWGRRTA